MTPIELAKKLELEIINVGNGNKRIIEGIYCCDLLSIVMGRAKQNDAWITVMGNINTIAVALLSDVSCIILSEGMDLNIEGVIKAKGHDICVLKSDLPTFELAMKIKNELR